MKSRPIRLKFLRGSEITKPKEDYIILSFHKGSGIQLHSQSRKDIVRDNYLTPSLLYSILRPSKLKWIPWEEAVKVISPNSWVLEKVYHENKEDRDYYKTIYFFKDFNVNLFNGNGRWSNSKARQLSFVVVK